MKGHRNEFPAKCDDCGQPVPAGEGVQLDKRTREDGKRYTPVVHAERCPRAVEGEPRGAEVPRWAVYDVEGVTPAGLPTVGVHLVDGERPAGDAHPVNGSAHKVANQSRDSA